MSIGNERFKGQAEGTFTYRCPGLDLLDNVETEHQESDITWEARIESVFCEYGIKASVVYVVAGVRIVTFAVQLGRGVRVNNVTSHKGELELGLGGKIYFEIPLKGTSYVGICLETGKIMDISLRTLFDSPAFLETQAIVPIVLGMSSKGNIVVDDLSSCGHILVGGATGSGKSVFLNQIIMGLLYKTGPDKVRMVLADESGINLSVYNGIPHLLLPVITMPRKFTGVMNWVLCESMQRKEKMIDRGAKSIESYNKLCPEFVLPHIVVVFDEYDALLENEDDIEALYMALTVGKLVGIHWILASQKVTPKTITQNLQRLVANRISFDVTSIRESKSLLGVGGAENLEGNGDMLYYKEGWKEPIRINSGIATDEEICRVIKWVCQC